MKKGFTLIELLAVIIILAIIALIATPIILRVIDNANRGAAARSVEGWIKSVDFARLEYIFEPENDNTPKFVDIADLVTFKGDEVMCQGDFNNEGVFTLSVGGVCYVGGDADCESHSYVCRWNATDGAECPRDLTAPSPCPTEP